MTKRNRIIGYTATGAVLAGLAFAGTASANVGYACDANPNNVRVTTTGHPTGAPITVRTFGNGALIDVRQLAADGSFTFPVADGVTVTGQSEQYGYIFVNGTFVKACNPPVVVPPPVIVEQPKQPETVTEQPKPPPKKVKRPPKRKVRVPLTCASFKRTHPTLGPKAYAKVGLRYWACHVPNPTRPPHVPVTG